MTAAKPLRRSTAACSHLPPAAIVLVCLIFSTCTGCHVLGIPSYRSPARENLASRSLADVACQSNCQGAPCLSDTENCEGEYRTGLLPPIPMPMWFAKWKAKRDFKEALPEAPKYPRFHPLPTRPVFSPRPGAPPSYLPNTAPSDAHHLADGMILGGTFEATPAPHFDSQPYQYGELPSSDGVTMEHVQPIPNETMPSPR